MVYIRVYIFPSYLLSSPFYSLSLLLSFFFFSILRRMGKNKAPTLPRIRYMCFDLTHTPVATAARAAATGLVSMSTRPDPEGSGTVEIATRTCPRLRVVVGLARAHPLTKPRLWSLPARLGPVTVHPTRWGVGPRL